MTGFLSVVILGVIASCTGGLSWSVTYSQFMQAVVTNGFPGPTPDQYSYFIKYSQKLGQISTLQEAAMALAQILHESDGLRARREYACTRRKQASITKCKHKYSRQGCDAYGQYYYGRGYMQLTWCTNYAAASRDIFGDNRLVFDPDMVATEDKVAWLTAFWVWGKKVHDKPGVHKGKFGATTKAINSGECRVGNKKPEVRFKKYETVRKAFGLQGSGDSSGCN